MKKALSILLSVLLLLMTMPLGVLPTFSVSAATSGKTGDCTWTLDDNGHLTISGNGAMWEYFLSDSCPWTQWSQDITTVIIESGVTNIGAYAFEGCTQLTMVAIPDTVTIIGVGAFDRCASLPSVTIPDCVTTIEDIAFRNCDALASVTIPDSVTTIKGYAFYNCASLTSVTIPDSVITIEDSAFYDCDSLTAVDVDVNNPNYCSVDGVLFSKDKTKLIQYPIGKSATSYNISDSVTTIGYRAFYNCDSLESVTIGDNVTLIGSYAFRNCTSLTSVTIPDSVTSIEDWTFYNCTSLTDVYYGGTEVQKVAISIGKDNDPLLNATWHYNYIPEEDTTPGNLTGDGEINNRDLAMLQQHLNGWDVTADVSAADCNGDGEINNRDLALLQQYLNGWDVELG